jgi:hypothetical protein
LFLNPLGLQNGLFSLSGAKKMATILSEKTNTIEPTYWLCLACRFAFRDDSCNEPCPTCGNDNPKRFTDVSLDKYRSLLKEYNTAKAKADELRKARENDKSAQQDKDNWILTAAAGVFGLVFGGFFWLEGAYKILSGWIIFLDWALARFGLPSPFGYEWHAIYTLASACLLGIGYRVVEIDRAPIKWPINLRRDFFELDMWRIRMDWGWQLWVVWFTLILTDVAAVYIGVRADVNSDIKLLREIAQNGMISGAYAMLLVFTPDHILRWSKGELKKAVEQWRQHRLG